MRNKEHIAATNRLCQINDLGSPRNTFVGNYCPFLGRVWNGNLRELPGRSKALDSGFSHEISHEGVRGFEYHFPPIISVE